MKSETITQRDDLIIRRHILEPGEVETISVQPGMADWDKPQARVHRGINAGSVPFEEVIVFFIDEPGMEPQPEVKNS